MDVITPSYVHPIDKVYAKMVELNFGDVITHEQLAYQLQVDVQSEEYRHKVVQLKERLLKAGKYIENVRGIGYKVTNPDDYADVAINQYRLGFNRLSKGAEILHYAPTNEMTQEGLANYNKVFDRAKQLHASLAGGVVELNLLNRKNGHPFLQANNKLLK